MSTSNIDPKIKSIILKCEENIKTSVQNTNDLNQLIEYLSNDDENIAFHALNACRNTFVHLFDKGSMSPVSNKVSGTLKDALEKYRSWLQERYNKCTEILASFLTATHSTKLQEASIRVLLTFLSKMTDSAKYDENEILNTIVTSMFKKDEFNPLPESCRVIFYNEYYNKYEDIKYYALKYYYNILEKFQSSQVIENPKKKRKTEENSKNNKDIYDIERIIENGYKLLTIKQTILKEDELPLIFIDLPPQDIKKSTLKFLNQNAFKALYSNCWISYLSLPLSQNKYKQILKILSNDILYNLLNPLLLSDFLTRCYSIGGYYSVLSLESLYILMNEYGLDYPLFYNQLYHVLEPSLFMMKNKAKFLNLLNQFLMSSHLSANLILSFIKKLSHISLFVPPDILLFILPVIYNLIVKHQPAYCLLHRDNDNEKKSFFDRLKKKIEKIDKLKNKQNNEDDNDEENDDNKDNKSEYTTSPPSNFNVNDLYKSDPYNYSLELDEDTNAGNSSLWELESLLNHYLSDVTVFTRNFQKKLEISYYNVNDYCDGSYASLIVNHMKVDTKQKILPLNYNYKEEFFPSDTSLSNSFSFA